MKTHLIKVWVFQGLATLMIALFSLTSVADNKISLVAGQNYYPYYAEDLENGGVITQIITEAFRREKYQINVRFIPWARAVHEVKTGKRDGIYGIWYRKEREEWIVYSDPLFLSKTMFLKRKENPISFKKLEDFGPHTIGIVRGYSYPKSFQEATYLRTIPAADNLSNMKLLTYKRIDLILIEQGVGSYLMNTLPELKNEKLEWLEPPLEVLPHHIGFSKKDKNHQRNLEAFNKGLGEIKADGTMRKIINAQEAKIPNFKLNIPAK